MEDKCGSRIVCPKCGKEKSTVLLDKQRGLYKDVCVWCLGSENERLRADKKRLMGHIDSLNNSCAAMGRELAKFQGNLPKGKFELKSEEAEDGTKP